MSLPILGLPAFKLLRCVYLGFFCAAALVGPVCFGTVHAAQGLAATDTETTSVADAETAAVANDSTGKANEAELATLLTGSRWLGQFTTQNKDGQVGAAKKESYEILKAEKLPDGNLWMLQARIKYGKRDVTVPLPIEILWAGRTPVITVDQLTIPGMGTFDARVLIRKGKYSGTWAHNDHGGHLFGVIERMTPKE